MLSFHGDLDLKNKCINQYKLMKKVIDFLRKIGVIKKYHLNIFLDIKNVKSEEIEEKLGIPTWLAYLQEEMFLFFSRNNPSSCSLCDDFPLRFLESIPVGVNLNQIKVPFLVYVLENLLSSINDKNSIKYISHTIKVLLSSSSKEHKDLANILWDYSFNPTFNFRIDKIYSLLEFSSFLSEYNDFKTEADEAKEAAKILEGLDIRNETFGANIKYELNRNALRSAFYAVSSNINDYEYQFGVSYACDYALKELLDSHDAKTIACVRDLTKEYYSCLANKLIELLKECK